MKVVLLKDVKGLGRAYSVIDAKDGHALNLLIPRGLAMEATSSALARAEAHKKAQKDKVEIQESLILSTMSALSEGRVEIIKKANDKGHLYDAVDAEDIAEATKLPAEVIALEKPLKEVGEFKVPVYFKKSFGDITVAIIAQ